MGRDWLIAATWLSIFVTVWAAPVAAAKVEIFPLSVDLSDRQLRGAITVVNNDDMPVSFQIERFLWVQEDGADRLIPTDKLLAVPLVFTVAPAASQVVRIGFRQVPDTDREVSYRLIFTEVPDTADRDTGMAVAVVLRLSLPVFFAPPTLSAAPQWSVRHIGPAALEVSLINAGNVHIRVTDLAVFAAAQQDRPVATAAAPRYVLPGASATWTLQIDRSFSEERVIIQAATQRGELRDTVAVSPP